MKYEKCEDEIYLNVSERLTQEQMVPSIISRGVWSLRVYVLSRVARLQLSAQALSITVLPMHAKVHARTSKLLGIAIGRNQRLESI